MLLSLNIIKKVGMSEKLFRREKLRFSVCIGLASYSQENIVGFVLSQGGKL